MKSCFFIDHWEVTIEVLPALCVDVERYIVEFSVTEFVVSNYGGFDCMGGQSDKDEFVAICNIL